MVKNFFASAVISASLLALSACSGSTVTPTEPQDIQTPPSSYESITDLRDAFVEAGGKCVSFDQNYKMKFATESGECSGGAVLSTYASSTAVKNQIDAAKDYFTGLESGPWLAGENWIINSDDAEVFQGSLGGELVELSQPEAQAGSVSNEEVFKAALLGSSLNFKSSDLDEAVQKARGYCILYKSGTKHEDVLQIVSLGIGKPFTIEQLGYLLGAGVSAFCPKYESEFSK